MPPKIVLKIIEGPSRDSETIFEDRTTAILGRATDCNIRLPNDEEHQKISRHHCILEVNPPDIRVRDFGSLHGTFVNDQSIGRRQAGMTPAEAARLDFPFVDLKSGDRLRLGKTVFQVVVLSAKCCFRCGGDLPDQPLTASLVPRPPVCDSCLKTAEKARASQLSRDVNSVIMATQGFEPVVLKTKKCAKCGCDVAKETDQTRPGEFVCSACRKDPAAMVQFLLTMAKEEKPELAAIKGYSILQELGRGGMGAVYLAQNDQTQEKVALKVMLPRIAMVEMAKKCFLREAENMKGLNHRNIVRLHHAGCSNGTFFFTLEYCNGFSLKELLALNRSKLPIQEALDITFAVLDGLEYAHQAKIPVQLPDGTIHEAAGIVHRDLKPENIFFSGSGKERIAKVGDYGLGKAFDTAGLSGMTNDGQFAGSPLFMPRQLVVNFKYAKPEADIWAAAACLYTMLCGFPPRDFPPKTIWYKVILETEPVPIRKRDASIPAALAEVIDHALIDTPEIPFKTAHDLRSALERVR